MNTFAGRREKVWEAFDHQLSAILGGLAIQKVAIYLYFIAVIKCYCKWNVKLLSQNTNDYFGANSNKKLLRKGKNDRNYYGKNWWNQKVG